MPVSSLERRGLATKAPSLLVLRRAAVLACSTADAERLAEGVIDLLAACFGALTVSVWEYDEASGNLVVLARNGLPSLPTSIAPGYSPVGVAFASGVPCPVEDYDAWELATRPGLEAGVKAAIAVPLVVEGRSIGGISLTFGAPRSFSAEDVDLLELVAMQVAPSLNASRIVREMAMQRFQLEQLQHVMSAATGELDPDALAAIVVRAAANALRIHHARLSIYDPSSGRLKIVATTDEQRVEATHFDVGPGGGVMGIAFERRESLAIDDYPGWEHALPWAIQAGYKSIAAVPLIVRDRAIGALAVLSMSRREFSSADTALLSMIGSQLGPVVEAAHQHAELLEYQRRLELILHRAPILLFALDAQYRVAFLQGSLMAKLGLPADGTGRRLVELSGRAKPIETAARTVLLGHGRRTSLSLENGLDLELEMQPVRDERDTVVGVIGVAVDVSERRLAMEAVQASEAKSKFLASMSHELRTPLNSVLGFAQLLGKGDLDSRQLRYVEHILTSGFHLLSLINDVLDLAKLQSDRLELRLDAVDVAKTIARAVEQMRPLAEQAELDIETKSIGPLVLRGDERRVMQVLLNLLANAIEFTPPKGKISVVAQRRRGVVRISVIDTGIGISSEDQARIFEEFYQVDTGRARRHEGTGLGLPLSRSIVEKMGGTLTVKSQPGRGSQFHVFLPTVADADASDSLTLPISLHISAIEAEHQAG